MDDLIALGDGQVDLLIVKNQFKLKIKSNQIITIRNELDKDLSTLRANSNVPLK
jgi:hypothetical protein